MNSWSNRFVSLAALAAVAGCHSTPRQPAPRTPQAVVVPATVSAPARATVPATAAAPATAGAAGAAVPTAPAPVDAPVPERAQQQYAQALNMMRGGRGTDAELEFKQLVLSYPQYSGPEVNLGLLYLHDARYPEAEKAFQAALERNPGNAVASNELGIAQRKLGKFAAAQAAYQRSITIDPNYAPAYLNLGVLYDLYLAEPQKALEQFEHYLTLVGDNKQVSGWVIELRKRVGAPAAAAKKEPA